MFTVGRFKGFIGGCTKITFLHGAGSGRSSLVRKHGGDSIADVRALSVFLRMRLVSLCLRCFLTDRTKRFDGTAMLWEQMMLCLTL
jgi:hypothetical protein